MILSLGNNYAIYEIFDKNSIFVYMYNFNI